MREQTQAPSFSTDVETALEALKLLADDTRWRIIGALRYTDLQVSELVDLLKLPANLISYHIGLLRQAHLVLTHRSDIDARVSYYGLDLSRFNTLYRSIGAELHVLMPDHATVETPFTVLFLCTENSARSQMAEGWLRYLSNGRIPVRSAGIDPQTIHPLAVEVMREAGVDIGYQRAKGLEEIHQDQSMVVVTVCDRAHEACPSYPRAYAQFHWSIPDPIRTRSAQHNPHQAFQEVRDQLRIRVEGLLSILPSLPSLHGE